jgi:predicted metalloprotease with PDZ domain
VLTGTPPLSSPLYEAGLDRGDRIITVGGTSVTTQAGLDELLAGHRPGDVISVRFESRGTLREAELTLAEDPALGASIRQRGAFLQSWKRAR